jgi:hypothetical protein
MFVWVCAVRLSGADIEVSASGGYGHIGGEAEDVSAQFAPLLGLSFSAPLGRLQVKTDYEHVNWKDRPGNLHMLGVGWLIQRRSGTTRPFFQVGWALGIERSHFEGFVPTASGVPVPMHPIVFVSRTNTNTFQGLALSGGITKSLGKGFFVRPEVRWRLIGPGPIMLTVPTVTLGRSF